MDHVKTARTAARLRHCSTPNQSTSLAEPTSPTGLVSVAQHYLRWNTTRWSHACGRRMEPFSAILVCETKHYKIRSKMCQIWSDSPWSRSLLTSTSPYGSSCFVNSMTQTLSFYKFLEREFSKKNFEYLCIFSFSSYRTHTQHNRTKLHQSFTYARPHAAVNAM